MFGIGPTELIVVLVIVLVIFGPSQLPKLGKMLGQTARSVRSGLDEAKDVGNAIDPTKPLKKAEAEESEEDEAAEE